MSDDSVVDLSHPAPALEELCAIARAAGDAVLEVYGREFKVQLKDDSSPLTEADQVAHRIIGERLTALDASLPLLSEESAPREVAQRRAWQRYWLVDPLDGTKEFLKRNGEFTVNIALVDDGRAVLGVVLAPVLARLYYGAVGHGAWRRDDWREPQPIRVRKVAASPLRVVGSRSHGDGELAAYIAALGPHEWKPMGSSLKICLIAEGAADIYPRLGPTSEWDTAAAQAILESAGGRMIDRLGKPLRYNTKDDLLNPHFLAFGDTRRDWLAPIQTTRGSENRH
jgi:3'(2'), 5'-bisphosphate nucleotidase